MRLDMGIIVPDESSPVECGTMSTMNLLVTGGSSFVGAHFCLRAAGRHHVTAVHHMTPLLLSGVSPVRADLRHPRDRARLQALPIDAVVHMACKIKGAGAAEVNRTMMDLVLSLGKPVIYASSTVVHWHQETAYGRSRREDEERLLLSGLPCSIIRPSAPYGPRLLSHEPRHKESFHTLAELVRSTRWVPVLGDGKYRRQPLHVHDFSDAILALLEGALGGKAYDAGGAEALSMNDVVDTIARAQGRCVRKLHIPKAVFVQLAKLSPNMEPELIASADEDEVADPSALSEVTGVRFRSFSEGVRCLI
jgi:nucleoside-diphosphate-sugar epimerase